ncbi:hypothetical protein F5X99DRAFT_392935 [Biscogniauxia marginata]|nr:hypothetical protein F5X99DRAFT_392935 [Biscogniauxia marginata]
MSRYIDGVPTPTKTRGVKMAVLSQSRSGTLGIYSACNMLGYHAYHTLEAFKQGVHHMKMLNEALGAGLQHRGKPFTRGDFDKWFADYDVITEVPAYMAADFIAAYPEAEYLLVERDPDALVRSWKATTFQFAAAVNSLPLSILKYFDPLLREVARFCDIILPAVTDGKGVSPDGEKALRRYYIDYLARVKELVPAEKLHVVRLEDGLGWEQLCPVLGEDVPDQKWPTRHSADEFKVIMGAPLVTGARGAMVKLTTLSVAILGVGAYLVMSYRR